MAVPVVRRLHPAVEIAGLALLLVIELNLSWDQISGPHWRTLPMVPAITALLYVPLFWRRRFPRAVFATQVIGSMALSLAIPNYLPRFGVWLALYTVASICVRRDALLALAATIGPNVFAVLSEVNTAAPDVRRQAFVVSALASTLVCLVAFGVGRWVRWSVHQRRLVAKMSANEAITTERSRIARELHDIVAHAITLMMLQSAGASHVLKSNPARAQDALRHVDELGQQAIVELRRMLGLLSIGDANDAAPDVSTGLSDLPRLIASAEEAGFKVDATIDNPEHRVEPTVSLSGYRIAQEAITNATRYGDPAEPIRIAARYRGNTLTLEVENGTAHSGRLAQLSIGAGILGMRERARAVGGTLTAGPTAQGHYQVIATLPMEIDT